MAVEKDEAETTRLKAPDPPTKLSHKQFRKLVKKERRRKKRQEAAKRREQQELEEKWRLEHDPVLRAKVEAREKAEKKRLQQEEDERQVQHRLWLEREAIAQEKFRKHKADEERKLKEKLEQEERIKREWEEQQRKEKEREERKQQQIKEKEEAFFKELDKPSTASERNNTWHNPLAPSAGKKSYGTEQDTVNCSFYLKTGACRFGERCSRHHPRPTSSVTLMIPAMYNDIRLSQSMLDEADHDTNLEYDEKDAYENFKQFFEDTLPEFKRAGTVVQFKVCCNHEPHLRGNVYVQFTSEEECAKAFAMFNARWYASKQLSCEFSPVTKWKSAICGLFERNRCPRGKNCNFLHVYLNPGNEFRVKDDLSPGRTPYSDRESERSSRGWRRDQWSRSRDLGREASHERGLGRETSHDRGLGREASHDRGLGREASHDRGLERDKWRDRDRDRGERDWSRERENRSRSRRRDDEREYSRMSERQERREGSRRVKADHNSEEEGEENGHQSERLSPGVEGSKVTENGSEHPESPHSPTENRKRKHRSSDKHSRRRKSKKKHKHRSEHKKKKRHNRSDSNSSSSDSENGKS